jgi:hypothetical protein
MAKRYSSSKYTGKMGDIFDVLTKDISNRSILEWLTQSFDKRGDFEEEELGQIYEIPVNPETGEYTHKDTRDRRYYKDTVDSYSLGSTESKKQDIIPMSIADKILSSPQDSITTSEYNNLIDSLLRAQDTEYVMKRDPFEGHYLNNDFRYQTEGWNYLDLIKDKAKGFFGRNK